jgi:PhnB protein
MPEVKLIPDGYPRVSPHLSIAGAAAAIGVYTSVLGAASGCAWPCPMARSPTPSSNSAAR